MKISIVKQPGLWLLFMLACTMWLPSAWADNGPLNSAAAATTAKPAYVDFQAYGDFSHRENNFSRDGYGATVGWAEMRFILRYKQTLPAGSIWRRLAFEPYVKGTLAASENSYYWENNLVYGVGLENRILDGLGVMTDPCVSWLEERIRLYVEVLGMEYTRAKADPASPQDDFRFGVDFWKEWNIPPDAKAAQPSNFWGEAWGNLSWRKTNFNATDYKSHVAGLMTRLGLKRETPVFQNNSDYSKATFLFDILPYAMLETGHTGKNYFWENQLNVGYGLRLMPVWRWGPKVDQQVILRIFAEALFNMDYYKGTPDPETPTQDFRAGVNFSFNLF